MKFLPWRPIESQSMSDSSLPEASASARLGDVFVNRAIDLQENAVGNVERHASQHAVDEEQQQEPHEKRGNKVGDAARNDAHELAMDEVPRAMHDAPGRDRYGAKRRCNEGHAPRVGCDEGLHLHELADRILPDRRPPQEHRDDDGDRHGRDPLANSLDVFAEVGNLQVVPEPDEEVCRLRNQRRVQTPTGFPGPRSVAARAKASATRRRRASRRPVPRTRRTSSIL